MCVKGSVTIGAEGNYLAWGGMGECPSEAGMDWPGRFPVLSQEFPGPGRLKGVCQVPSLAQGNDLPTPPKSRMKDGHKGSKTGLTLGHA